MRKFNKFTKEIIGVLLSILVSIGGLIATGVITHLLCRFFMLGWKIS